MTVEAVSNAEGTVLIVDDEPSILRVFKRALEDATMTVETCSTAREAIDRIARGGVHVVVSDIAMPDMSGVDLLKTIRKHDADLPMVLVTGNPDVESASSAVRYGAFKYLMKPVRPAELQATVSQAARLYTLAHVKRKALTTLGLPGAPTDRASFEASFERAIESIWIAFQPIVSARDGSTFGYEALLRSNDPTLPAPLHLIAAAERLGLTARLGRAVRQRTAMAAHSAERAEVFFVNLHPQDLLDPQLADPESPFTKMADRVVLELTERATLGSISDVAERVTELRRLGYRIAIDDLGAGYAGLTSFALLEPEIVKLDMTLVRDIDASIVRQKLIKAMTSLCKDMGMSIVAEGVETAAERDVLIELGCDLLQGFLFARPGPPFPKPQW